MQTSGLRGRRIRLRALGGISGCCGRVVPAAAPAARAWIFVGRSGRSPRVGRLKNLLESQGTYWEAGGGLSIMLESSRSAAIRKESAPSRGSPREGANSVIGSLALWWFVSMTFLVVGSLFLCVVCFLYLGFCRMASGSWLLASRVCRLPSVF